MTPKTFINETPDEMVENRISSGFFVKFSSKEKPFPNGLTFSVLHFFICVIHFDYQDVGVRFLNEGNSSFHHLEKVLV